MTETFEISGLYVLTHHDNSSCDDMLSDIEDVLKGGAKLIQFRSKTLNEQEKLKRACKLLELCNSFHIPLIINDDVFLCKEIHAHGVHLGQQDSHIKEARALLGEGKIIGATCHQSPDLAFEAKKSGADYIALGSFFASQTKVNASRASLDCIRSVKQACGLPIVAIGGINLDNASELLAHKVDALAVINGVLNADDIETQARQFTQLFNIS